MAESINYKLFLLSTKLTDVSPGNLRFDNLFSIHVFHQFRFEMF